MKKLFVALGICLSIGLVGVSTNHSFAQVRAEDETSESTSESEEESIVEEESESFYDELSQTAKDVIGVVKEFLNQPITIGAVSTTLGAIIIFAISKLVSSLSKTKLNDLTKELLELGNEIADSVSKKDYNALAKQTQELVNVCKILVDNTKNVKVKEKALALLEEMQPIIEDNKEFAKKEVELVVEDSKAQASKSAQDIIEIVNKD